MGPALTFEMSTSSANFTIPRLRDDGGNWTDYKVKVESALGARGLLKFVNGTAHTPRGLKIISGVAVNTAGDPATDEEIEAAEKRQEEFDQKEYMARHLLQASIPPRLLSEVRTKTAAEMWTAIQKDVAGKSELYVEDLRRRLHEMHCDEQSDIHSHVMSLKRAPGGLLGLGDELKDIHFIPILIGSLPDSYRTMLSTVTRTARVTGNTLPASEVVNMVIEEAAVRKRQTERSKSSELALQTSKATHGKGFKSSAKCSNCGKTGHEKPDCYSKGGGKEGQAPWQKKKEAHKAKMAESKTDETSAAGPSNQSKYAFSSRKPNAPQKQPVDDAIADSGASSHYSPLGDRLVNLRDIPYEEIEGPDGTVMLAKQKGDLHVVLPNGNSSTPVTLKNVFYVPNMSVTLISIAKLDQAGYWATFGGGKCTIKAPDRKVIAQLPLTHGLYRVVTQNTGKQRANAVVQKLTLTEAHRVLGHISHGAVKAAVRDELITGIELDETEPAAFCDACAQAKPHRKPFPKVASSHASELGGRVVGDLWGPASVESLGGKRYSFSLLDQGTHWTDEDYLKNKSEALDSYKAYDKRLETQHGVRIKIFRSDRGGEFASREFEKYLKERGTQHEFTVHDTHEQVGVVERMNRTRMELTRAMLFDSRLPKYLWAEASSHAVWIINRVPTRALDGKTPYEAKYGVKPDFVDVVAFGTRAWVKIVDAGKLDRRARLGYFVGYDSQSTGYRIYFPDKRSVNVEREVVFDRTVVQDTVAVDLGDVQLRTTAQSAPHPPANEQPKETSSKTEQTGDTGDADKQPELEAVPERSATDGNQVDPDLDVPLAQRRPRRPNTLVTGTKGYFKQLDDRGLPTRSSEKESANIAMERNYAFAWALETSPATLAEALEGPNAKDWQKAWDDELAQLQARKTWIVVDRPKDKPVIPCRVILREKPRPNGEVLKRKARLVAGGHKQEKGINYDETFAAVARIASIRVVLALAAARDWEVGHVDIVGAYLNCELEEEVYMQAPPGVLGPKDEGKVCKLLRALYGLKQAGRAWWKKMTAEFVDMGFTPSVSDPSLFCRFTDAGDIIVPVSTDDMTITGSSRAAVDAFKAELAERFEIVDMGPLHWLLGFEVKRNRAAPTLSISQRGYIEAMAKRFRQETAKPVYTPMNPGDVFDKTQCPEEPIDVPSQQAVGHALWPAVVSRPDMQNAVGILRSLMQNPATSHWEAVKRFIRYAYTTRDLGLTLGGKEIKLEGYVDADWASQPYRHSISGHVFSVTGGATVWSSKRQTIIAKSTAEVEYVAGAGAGGGVRWMRTLLKEMRVEQDEATTLNCDNQSAIAICKSEGFHARTKHMDIRYHSLRESFENGTINPVYVPSDDNPADVFTKALARPKFERFREALGIRAFD